MSDVPAPGPRLSRLKLLALVVLVVGLVADLASKAWLAELLAMDPGSGGPFRQLDLIPGFFALEGTYNPGVTFGLAPGKTEWIIVFTVLATVALLAWLLATRRRSVVLHLALGLVLAGALGNLWDRLHWHKVRDFFLIYLGDLSEPSFKWPNFNVADSMIVVGVCLILALELFGRRTDKEPSAPAGTT